jgi:hypothetical protein
MSGRRTTALLMATAMLSGTLASKVEAQDRIATAIKPTDEVIRLCNGKDLSGLYAWVRDGQRNDTRRVFSVQDGVIHVSGEGFGYLATEREYRDYHLTVEYKWGQRTDGGKYVRNSGILLHAIGPDGNAGKGAWMASIECQLAQGCAGDLIPIRGMVNDEPLPVSFKSEIAYGPDKRPRWKPGGEVLAFTSRQLWWNQHDPDFQELLDTRGQHDVESPRDQWTKVECLCDGNRITVRINGVTVNQCFDVSPAAGKILLQSEGHEISFRNFELHPLKK